MDGPTRPGPSTIGAVGTCAAAIAAYLFLHALVFVPQWTDENVHLYVAERIAAGALPYAEVPSARPPLALAPLVVLLALGLPSLLAARAAVALLAIATATGLLWAGLRLWGPVAGVAAFAWFLLSAHDRAEYTGIHAVELGMTATALLAVLRCPRAAGVAGGMALAAGQHAAVVVGVAAVLATLRSRREGLRMLAGLVLTLAALFGLTFAVGGETAWSYLVLHHTYHLDEPGSGIGLRRDLLRWGLDNLPLLLVALAALAMRGPAREGLALGVLGPAWLLALCVAAHVLVVGAMRGGLILYVKPVTALIAVLAGLGMQRVWEARRSPLLPAAAVFLIGATLASWEAGRQLTERRDGDLRYPLLPVQRSVLSAELQDMVVADRMASMVVERTTVDQTVFGHGSLVGLVASKAGRRVSAELVDLAPRWFQMGVLDREAVTVAVELDGVQVFVTPRWFYTRDPWFQGYLRSCYAGPEVFERERRQGRGIPDLLLFERLDIPRPCLPDPALVRLLEDQSS